MKKILVANRGEIALRVMKTAKKMGIQTVAIYSDIDRNAPHVLFADEAVCIGTAQSSHSYLRADHIIELALGLGVDGIHPGYGFLSENADFAKKVSNAGIRFIGPSPESIITMGSKIGAKEAVKSYGIPMVPGMDKAIVDKTEAINIAKSVGFPVLIKASAGGGGKGMRVVNNEEELPEQMERAMSEALSAFGDNSVFIEKYIASPRHIEIQILADDFGNVVHLFERECSIQRRHQKLVEEAPSSILTPEVRKAMGKAACDVALACNYSGAGTVEFLIDEHLNFYFLEMNTRLQVEHPVSEWICGLDLVEEQIKVARGEKLKFTQEDLKILGHAIELRICAEDPSNNFLPSIGTLEKFHLPNLENVRLDSGYTEGMEIPIQYDPLIAKLIAWGNNRSEAIQNLIDAINNFTVEGIKTTLGFGKFVLEHPDFISGKFDTNFIPKNFNPNEWEKTFSDEKQAAAALALHLFESEANKISEIKHANSNWQKSRIN
jgi:acetyl-CoA carboxylase biotin carboxylase subunit